MVVTDTSALFSGFACLDPAKRTVARKTLRKGLAENQLALPHQALVEFIQAVTKGTAGTPPLLDREKA